MSEKVKTKTTWCPDCDATIAFSTRMKLGKSIECPECGVVLEVISLNPLEVDYALEDDDWEEYEDDDWDDDDEEV
jgi:lysine biosynthesis protein LysW